VTSEFEEAVEQYRQFLVDSRLDAGVTRTRMEIHVESLRDWSQVADLQTMKSWFLERRRTCTMVVEDIPLARCRGWQADPDNGWLRHESGEFFYIQGVRVSNSEFREAGTGWDQPMMTQVGYDGGILGIIRKRIRGAPHYLIEAKAEPGNYERVQMSPTLQATFSNLKQAHKGRIPTFAEYFLDPIAHGGTVLYDQWMSEDGGRLHMKRNRGMLVELPEEFTIDPPASFSWLSMWQIKECLLENAWVNPHVRGIISHL
jgi:oxidase EvaA